MTATPGDEPARLRQLLDDVAAGRVTPLEASALLADRDTTSSPTADGTGTRADPQGSPADSDTDAWAEVSDVTTARPAPAADTGPAQPGDAADVVRTRRVLIRAVGRRVRIIGEPSVATVSVDGAHVVRREGATLTVTSEGEIGASLDGFTLMRSRSFDDVRDSLLGFRRELAVRVNPDLEVEIEVTAGGVFVERVPKVSHVRVTAGSARVLDAVGPLDLLVQAGSAKVDIRPTSGASRLRVESGSLDVRIGAGSDVRVRSDAQLGRVSWHGSRRKGSADEVTVGTGSATLDLEVVMGSVQVSAD